MSYKFATATGLIIPDDSELRADVQQEYINALGQEMSLDMQTPQGRLIDAETDARSSVLINNCLISNQLNPDYATGVFLRSIGALSGINDIANTKSVCSNVLVEGLAGTIIPRGSRIKNSQGAIFQSSSEITIAPDGTGSGAFESVDFGPVEADANTLTIIVDSFVGWSTVTNPTAAVTGTLAITDAEYRTKRRQFIFSQGNGTIGAIYANVKAIKSVSSLVAIENADSSPAVIKNVTLPAKSVWVCVDGGNDAEIGLALLSSKSAGAEFTHADQGLPVTVSVTEPNSLINYDVKYVTPQVVPVICRIIVSVDNTVTDPYTSIPLAIQEYVNGKLPNQRGLVLGADVSPFDLAGAAMIGVSGVYVQSCEVSATDPSGYTKNPIEIEVWQRASLPISAITVVVV